MLGFSRTRNWIYADRVDGRFQRLRRWTFLALLLVLFVTPWVRARGNPALEFDLAGRHLYAFGSIFTTSDTLLLLLLLLFLAFSLFFLTSLFGRLWCGYACPQTVFLVAGRIVANLVGNALKFTPASGEVRLTTALTGNEMRVNVADTGPGIPESEWNKVLRPFYRLESSRTTQGSGLGLSLVAAIAQRHAAKLSFADNGPEAT